MRHVIPLVGVACAGLLLGACATQQGRFMRMAEPFPARPETCEVEVMRSGLPTKEFVRIARLDVHLEKTHFIRSGFEEAWPELRRQACLSGADAIIEMEERTSSYLETRIYHVTATGIKYR